MKMKKKKEKGYTDSYTRIWAHWGITPIKMIQLNKAFRKFCSEDPIAPVTLTDDEINMHIELDAEWHRRYAKPTPKIDQS